MRSLRRVHDDIIRQMAEPEDLRDLRRQVERIRARTRHETEAFMQDMERRRLRSEIIKAGEVPCR